MAFVTEVVGHSWRMELVGGFLSNFFPSCLCGLPEEAHLDLIALRDGLALVLRRPYTPQKEGLEFLSLFCYRFNRRLRLEAMLPRLGYAAVRTPPMPFRFLRMAEVH